MVKSIYNIEGKKCYKACGIIKKANARQSFSGFVVDDLYFITTENKQIMPVPTFYLINNLEEDEAGEL